MYNTNINVSEGDIIKFKTQHGAFENISPDGNHRLLDLNIDATVAITLLIELDI